MCFELVSVSHRERDDSEFLITWYVLENSLPSLHNASHHHSEWAGFFVASESKYSYKITRQGRRTAINSCIVFA